MSWICKNIGEKWKERRKEKRREEKRREEKRREDETK